MSEPLTLYLIPARGGSKGIPGKNIKPLGGKPLLEYSIDVARQLTDDENICLSTDSEEIKAAAEAMGLKVPFLRPDYLATDGCGTHDVILHALDFHKAAGRNYERVVLLQPTSPFREAGDVKGALELWSPGVELVVSVCEAATNPYLNCYELDEEGFLHISKGEGTLPCRQAAPKAYEFNGAVYVIDVAALRKRTMGQMKKRVPFFMPRERSIDLDTPLDWLVAETLMTQTTQPK